MDSLQALLGPSGTCPTASAVARARPPLLGPNSVPPDCTPTHTHHGRVLRLICVPTGTCDLERPERAPGSAGWAPRGSKLFRCSTRTRSRGRLDRRAIDPRLWARNVYVVNEVPATRLRSGASGGGAAVEVGFAGARRTTGRANGDREQKNILTAAPKFGGSSDRTMSRVCAGWQGRRRAGSARDFAFVCSPVGLFVRSPPHTRTSKVSESLG